MTPRQQRLFDDHRQVAVGIARGIARSLPRTVLREDLEAAALAGLWDAIRLNSRADPFGPYARLRIRGAVMDELRTQDWLPRYARRKLAGEAPSLVCMGDVHPSLLVADSTPDEQVISSRQAASVRKAIKRLLPKEQHLVQEYYFKGRPLHSIGEDLGLSEVRMSQIHAQVRQKLRVAMVLAGW